MAQLIAIVYPDEATAGRALEEIRRQSQGHTLTLLDAVVATKGSDGKLSLQQSMNMTSLGALSGAFWGTLVGLLFLVPLAGAAAGAAAGAITGYFTDYGINDDFIRHVSGKLNPGGAALFALSAEMTAPKVAGALSQFGGEILYSSVSDEVEQHFRNALGGGQAGTAASRPELIGRPT